MDCIQIDYIGIIEVNQGNNGNTMGEGKVTMGTSGATDELQNLTPFSGTANIRRWCGQCSQSKLENKHTTES